MFHYYVSRLNSSFCLINNTYFSDIDNASLNDDIIIINDSHRQTGNIIILSYQKQHQLFQMIFMFLRIK